MGASLLRITVSRRHVLVAMQVVATDYVQNYVRHISDGSPPKKSTMIVRIGSYLSTVLVLETRVLNQCYVLVVPVH